MKENNKNLRITDSFFSSVVSEVVSLIIKKRIIYIYNTNKLCQDGGLIFILTNNQNVNLMHCIFDRLYSFRVTILFPKIQE